MRPNPENIRPIVEYPSPTNLKELRRTLGMLSWYQKFLPNYSDRLAPLTNLLKSKVKWHWGQKQDETLQYIKRVLTTEPVLYRPDWSLGVFYIQCDSFDFAVAGLLSQRFPVDPSNTKDPNIKSNYVERIIEYASRTLTDAEKNYSTTEKELLAVIFVSNICDITYKTTK